MKFPHAVLAAMLLLPGCNQYKPVNQDIPGQSEQILYARGFSLEKSGNQVRIHVSDPWQNADGTVYSYLLSDTVATSHWPGNNTTVIRVPVRKVVCLSTTHIGFIGLLNRTETIAGVSGKEYVADPQLRRRIEQQTVVDVGYDENINYELIVSLDPDVVFAYGVTAMVTKTVAKLQELGIPVVLVAEYLEEDPLAKMEWLKFFAAFYGTEEMADNAVDSVASRYNALKELASHVSTRPSVVTGLPWRGTWYVSGGRSYIARLIGDAGANYVWRSLEYSDSKPVPLEKVFENAMTADFWINTGDAGSRNDIAAADVRFRNLLAFRNGEIYNNNRQMGPAGGNAYFERGVVEPDVILADLISIFHPQLLPSHELTYYQKLH